MPTDQNPSNENLDTPHIERQVRIDASPELVFQFLTDPERLAQWMGSPAGWDAQPGGALKIAIDGVHPVSGTFVEVDSPRRIVFTWGWDLPEYGVPPGGSTVEIDLAADGDGTVLWLRHLGLPGDAAENSEGWAPFLHRLAAVAEAASHTRKDQNVSERAEALAKALEESIESLIVTVEACSDEQVRLITEAEGWPVAVAAHHVAVTYPSLIGLAQVVANGQSLPEITMEMIDEANAKHAEEFFTVSREETLAELRSQGAAAVATIGSFTDEQLARSASLPLVGGASWSTADIIERILIGHPQQHGDSIRATLARPVAVKAG